MPRAQRLPVPVLNLAGDLQRLLVKLGGTVYLSQLGVRQSARSAW